MVLLTGRHCSFNMLSTAHRKGDKVADRLTIKSSFKSIEGNHVAVRGDEIIARIVGGRGGRLRITNRLYTVIFNTGKTIEFNQLTGFTFDQVSYSMYQNKELLGNLKRKTIKGSYEINLYEVEVGNRNLLKIDEGWISRGTTRYINLNGNEITIVKGRTGLFDWKVSCKGEISEIDIALILFMKAMCGLMIQ